MSRIGSIFAELRSRKTAALMPFITAGFPSIHATRETILALEQAGASIVELGFPFSDPIADGPVIAASMHKALQEGITPAAIFDMVRQARGTTNLGLVAMVSDSIVTRMGPERFVADAANAGIDGLIVPDIDLDAAAPLAGLARMHRIALSLLIAPTTQPQRIKRICELSSGFIYLLARVGITGERDELNCSDLTERVAMVREHTDLPVAVGFGISKPEHVAAATAVADAAIVGSALVRRMAESGEESPAAAKQFIQELAAGLRKPL